MAKSYWQDVLVRTDRDKAVIKSWFGALCDDDMVPYEAAILCDIQTDAEKKIRAFMTDAQGRKFKFERTKGGKTFSISRKPLTA
jgi:hypothetical protein